MRKTVAAIAFALLWAPSTNGFMGQSARIDTNALVSPVSTAMSATALANDSFDQDALDRKNASRKKFGLKPMTPEEFMENEAKVQQLVLEQEHKAAALQQEAAQKRRVSETRTQSPVPGFLDKIFGDALPETCESNYDCQAPKVCCDFGVSKVCCSGGSKQRSREGELALVPVPVDVMPPSNKY